MSEVSAAPPAEELPTLDQEEARILGSLMEKQCTVPASYPLTLNSLLAACNQSSSREPVVDWDEPTVQAGLDRLRQRGLVSVEFASRGSRTRKYSQHLTNLLAVRDDEAAVLTVLLLRGPQAPGELRTRTERLHRFADRDQVEQTLAGLAARRPALVTRLERRPGQQDHRWASLLTSATDGPAAEPDPAQDDAERERILAGGPDERDERVREVYDRLAPAYQQRRGSEPADKPFDHWLLTRVAELAGAGPILDVGCGPGQVTAHLAAAGADASGLDLSPRMIEVAGAAHPQLRFEVGNLTRLLRPPAAAGWAALTSWYSLVHLAPSELPALFAGWARVLAPGGWLAIATHAATPGHPLIHLDTWFDQPADLDFVLHDPATLRAAVAAAGFEVSEWYLRSSLDHEEADTQRIYLLARSPGGPVIGPGSVGSASSASS